MNVKRFLAASLAVYVAAEALGLLIHAVILKSAYEATSSVWRPDMQQKLWIEWLDGLIVSLLFTYIFARGYQARGIMEGVRFGVVIGLFAAIPMSYGMYMILPIPYSLALQWFLYGFAQWIAMGIVVSLVYKPAGAPAAAA